MLDLLIRYDDYTFKFLKIIIQYVDGHTLIYYADLKSLSIK